MKPQERFQLTLGIVMVGIYLFGGIFVIFYAKTLFPESRLPSVMGWVMIAYSLLRAMRVYEVLKKIKKEGHKSQIRRKFDSI